MLQINYYVIRAVCSGINQKIQMYFQHIRYEEECTIRKLKIAKQKEDIASKLNFCKHNAKPMRTVIRTHQEEKENFWRK